MNNSKLAIESVSLTLDEQPDHSEHFQKREGELIKIIEDIQTIAGTDEWSSLKEKIFDPLVTTLEKEIGNEGKKENPDTLKLNRLSGQLKWAEKYSDLSKLATIFRVELSNIRLKLYGTTEKS